jgi:hypothetical protein
MEAVGINPNIDFSWKQDPTPVHQSGVFTNEERFDSTIIDKLFNNQRSEEANSGFWGKAQSIAEWICSRESTFRSALDITGWEIPTMLAAATRNIYQFYEAAFQAVTAFSMLVFAPNITKGIAHLIGGFFLKGDEKKDLDKYLLFGLNDLDNQETAETALSRIAKDEPEDCSFLASLYKNSPSKIGELKHKAKDIVDFCNRVSLDEGLISRVKKFKKAVVIGESFIESSFWGTILLMTRLFRKYVLGQDRFTGTKAYESDEEAKLTGDNQELQWWQKLGVFASSLTGPIMNIFLLNKVEDKKALGSSKFLQMAKNQLDMTHGVYPKIGLLASYMLIPYASSGFFAAQGKNEMIEHLLKELIMDTSWWMGHRLTNGSLAKMADKALKEKFGQSGILVEEGDLAKAAPEPAKIQHVMSKVRHDPELEKEARKKHAQVLFGGFGLHSLLVFGAKMFINWITKWRVSKKLRKA